MGKELRTTKAVPGSIPTAKADVGFESERASATTAAA
jgi:hypothetical protein